MKEISKLIKDKKLVRDHRNSYEYQAYGNKLALDLEDTKHRALYIRLAKNEDRNLLELARIFVVQQKDQPTKGRLFMWKLKQLKEAKNAKNELNKQEN